MRKVVRQSAGRYWLIHDVRFLNAPKEQKKRLLAALRERRLRRLREIYNP